MPRRNPKTTSSTKPTQATLPVVGVALFFALASVQPAAAQDLGWELLEPRCGVTGPNVLACGDFGTYIFFDPNRSHLQRGGNCELLGTGVQDPAALQLPALVAPAYVPCAGGSCFSEDVPDGKWAAVIDWDDSHGHTVAGTIQHAASDMTGDPLAVLLYDLEIPEVELIAARPEVSDAHVLAQLCHIHNDVRGVGPAAVNMSFGRLDLDGSGCGPGAEDSLECEVEEVLADMRDRFGTIGVAAAGNHGQLLYPARAPAVLAVGNLDVSSFGATGSTAENSYSPETSNAVFPGYGLYLEEPDGPGVWAAPPGTSYASAFATGWLLAWEDAVPGALDFLRSGQPYPPLGVARLMGGRAALVRGTEILAGSDLEAPNRILETAIGLHPAVCNALNASENLHLVLSAVEAPDLGVSFADQAATSFNPSPGSRPCVPCAAHRRRSNRASGDGYELRLELEAGGGVVPASELLEVLVRVENSWFEITGDDALAFEQAIENGTAASATLDGFPFELGADAAMVYRLRNPDGIDFWDATPILIHQDEFDPYIARDDFENGIDPWSKIVPTG